MNLTPAQQATFDEMSLPEKISVFPGCGR